MSATVLTQVIETAFAALDPDAQRATLARLHDQSPPVAVVSTFRLPGLSYDGATAVTLHTTLVAPPRKPHAALTRGLTLTWVGHRNVRGPKGGVYTVLRTENTPLGPCTWKLAAAQDTQLSSGGDAEAWVVPDATPGQSAVLGTVRLCR